MKIHKNTLEAIWERVEGTKEGKRVVDIVGGLDVELTDDEIQAYEEDEEELVKQITIPLKNLGFPKSVLGVRWFHELASNFLTLTVNPDELEAEIEFP